LAEHDVASVNQQFGIVHEIDTATSIVKEWHDDLEAEFGQDYSY
jgi:hypothetical protein